MLGVPPARTLLSWKVLTRSSASLIESPCPLMLRLQSSGSSITITLSGVDFTPPVLFEPNSLMKPPANFFRFCVFSSDRVFVLTRSDSTGVASTIGPNFSTL